MPLQAPRQHKQLTHEQDQYKQPDPVLMHQQLDLARRVLAIGSCVHLHMQPPHICAEVGLTST